MRIYEASTTPSAKRVGLFLAEKGLEVERVSVDVRGGENLTEAFAAKSVNGRIPVLELDDGTTICESMAICRYFDAQYPDDKHLFGDSALAVAQVEMWNRIIELQGLMVAFQAFRNITGIYKDRENCIAEWGYESKQRLEAFVPLLERRLAQVEYVAGGKFSVADITAYVTCGFLAALEISLDSYPHIQRWYAQIGARPAFS
ncbi:glutathione S-transferase family protein [Thaumasiovibrio sp. DFM-14]|uniref:glutathione S-transferase family protein n=1 Tax=Thaumasiovibrio sp. DFM-14 TaxID=3384792 RepID=UPI0039A1D7E4